MAIRKNKKRIDPRYFLHETTYRDLDEAPANGDVEEIAKVAEELPNSRAGQEVIQKALDNPEILSLVDDLIQQVQAKQEIQEYDDNNAVDYSDGTGELYRDAGDDGGSAMIGGGFGGPLLYTLIGMPGYEEIMAHIGPLAAQAGMMGATAVGGAVLALIMYRAATK